MNEIKPFRVLTLYENYADAFVFEYSDDHQKFYFDVQFANATPPVIENGAVIAPATYDVAVSNIGKRDWGARTTKPVKNLDVIKSNLTAYFRSHFLDQAQNVAEHVIFE